MNQIARQVLRDIFGGSGVPLDHLDLANRIASSIDKHTTQTTTSPREPRPRPHSKAPAILVLLKDGATVAQLSAVTGTTKNTVWRIIQQLEKMHPIERTGGQPIEGRFGKPPTVFKLRPPPETEIPIATQ